MLFTTSLNYLFCIEDTNVEGDDVNMNLMTKVKTDSLTDNDDIDED